MNVLKKILVNTVILISLNSVAQSNKPLVAVFKQSYEYEATKNYEAAINVINSLYSESSYEINLRLAWLYYLSGNSRSNIWTHVFIRNPDRHMIWYLTSLSTMVQSVKQF